MHWFSKLLALAATGSLGANAFETSIFTFPSSNHELRNSAFEQQTVSEDVARLILELRTRSSLATVLGKADTDTVDRLNQFAEADSTLFGGSSSHDAQGKSIIFLEGLERELGSRMRKSQPDSVVVPRTSWGLVQDSLDSARGTDIRGKRCIYLEGASQADSETAQSAQECLARDPVFSRGHGLFDQALLGLIDSVDTWASKDQRTTASMISFKETSQNSKVIIKSIESLFQDMADESLKGKRDITAVLLPSTQGPKYSTQILRRNMEGRSGSAMSSTNARDGLSKAGQDFGIHSNLAPVCHSSNSSCAEATNDCSGHGYCYLKHGPGDEGSTGNCYACRCQQTVVRKSDGTTQKVQWGGPACEKKDISSPFFLIVGVSVLVIVTVGSAVGMLFGMGQEELPSVIAAGVGPSKAQT